VAPSAAQAEAIPVSPNQGGESSYIGPALLLPELALENGTHFTSWSCFNNRNTEAMMDTLMSWRRLSFHREAIE